MKLACNSCAREFDHNKRGQQPTLCPICRSHDKGRNSGRKSRLSTMFVGVDGGGEQVGDYMHYRTLSFGREDGTSGTHHVVDGDVASALLWLLTELHGPYVDANGRSWRQQPVAFHFSPKFLTTILKYFPESECRLVHKAQARILTPLCGFDD